MGILTKNGLNISESNKKLFFKTNSIDSRKNSLVKHYGKKILFPHNPVFDAYRPSLVGIQVYKLFMSQE